MFLKEYSFPSFNCSLNIHSHPRGFQLFFVVLYVLHKCCSYKLLI